MSYPLDWKLVSVLFRTLTNSYKGLENIKSQGPFIFAANHVGLIDSPFIASVLIKKLNHHIYFLAKKELINQYGDYVSEHLLHLIPVDPHKPAQCIDKALEKLQSGNSIMIYPEGRRNTYKNLLPGKTGVARLALTSRCPVIPIGYNGPTPTQTQENFWTDFKDLIINNPFKSPIVIKIGTPITFGDDYSKPISYDLLKKTTRKIMLEISNLCGKMYPY